MMPVMHWAKNDRLNNKIDNKINKKFNRDIKMKLEDQTLEKLLRAITPFILSELEEVVSFEGKNDEQREDIIKTATKSLEVSTILFSKFLKDDSIDATMLDKVTNLIAEEKMEEAADIINNR